MRKAAIFFTLLVLTQAFIPIAKVFALPLMMSISLSVSSNRATASDQDIITYDVVVSNMTSDEFLGLTVTNYLPEFVTFVSTDFPDYQLNGSAVSFTTTLSNHQTIRLHVTGRLDLPSNVTGGQLTDILEVTYNTEMTRAADTIEIVPPPPPPTPDFSVFYNCVLVSPDNTFTAYFGYLNQLSNVQNLDSSIVTPSVATPPQALGAGRQDRIFSATTSVGANITWTAVAGSVTHSATASAYSDRCALAVPILESTAVSTTRIDLSWGSVQGAFNYELYRNGSLITTVSSNSYSDSGLSPATSYTYQIRAFGDATSSGTSMGIIATTLAPVADFTVFVNCVTTNSDNTYTAYFGYNSNMGSTTNLNSSSYTPTLSTNPVQILQPGNHDKVFSAIIPMGTSVIWTATSGSLTRTTTAADNLNSCSPTSVPEDGSQNNSGITKVKIKENAVPAESVIFNEGSMKVTSDCTTKRVSISGAVSANVSLASLEYSLDGGNKWMPVINTKGLATKALTFGILTRSLKDKIYGIKLRASTSSNTLFTSQVVNHLQNCTGTGSILGSFYQNGFGQGLISNNGDLLYNSSLPLKLFVETMGNISDLKAKVSSDSEFKENVEIVNLKVDYATGIWSVEIPADILKNKTVYIRLDGVSGESVITKNIANVINIQFLNSADTKPQEGNYKYELYFNDGISWQKLDYDKEVSATIENGPSKKFNLYSGTYYFKVTYPNGLQFYTKHFTVSEPSIVQVLTKPLGNSSVLDWISSVFQELEVKIYTQKTLNDSLSQTAIQNGNAQDFEIYSKILESKTKDLPKDTKIAVIYWNSWNPIFSEQMTAIKNIQKYLDDNSITNRKLYLVTDDNNYEGLARTLKINKLNIEYFKVVAPDFYIEETGYQPEIVIIDLATSSIKKIRGNQNFDDLNQELNNLNFINNTNTN